MMIRKMFSVLLLIAVLFGVFTMDAQANSVNFRKYTSVLMVTDPNGSTNMYNGFRRQFYARANYVMCDEFGKEYPELSGTEDIWNSDIGFPGRPINYNGIQRVTAVWTSSNENLLTVNQLGIFNAISAATETIVPATVTVTSYLPDGSVLSQVSKTRNFTVKASTVVHNPDIAHVDLVGSNDIQSMYSPYQYWMRRYYTTDEYKIIGDGNNDWSLENNQWATIGADGILYMTGDPLNPPQIKTLSVTSTVDGEVYTRSKDIYIQ